MAAIRPQLDAPHVPTPMDRWNGIVRPYSVHDVEKLRGSVRIEYTLAKMGANRLWHHFEPSPWLDTIQQAFAPVAIGLMAAGVWLLARLALEGTLTVTIAVISTAVLLARHVNPLYLIVAGALTKLLVG